MHVFGANQHQNSNEADVEYRLIRRWLLQTAFGDAGVGGVDVFWTYRYSADGTAAINRTRVES